MIDPYENVGRQVLIAALLMGCMVVGGWIFRCVMDPPGFVLEQMVDHQRVP